RRLQNSYGSVTAFSADGRLLACGVGVGKFELFDLKGGKRLSTEAVLETLFGSAFLSGDGMRATTCSAARAVHWDLATGRRAESFDLPRWGCVAPLVSPNGRYLVTNTVWEQGVKTLELWDAVACKRLHELARPEKNVWT